MSGPVLKRVEGDVQPTFNTSKSHCSASFGSIDAQYAARISVSLVLHSPSSTNALATSNPRARKNRQHTWSVVSTVYLAASRSLGRACCLKLPNAASCTAVSGTIVFVVCSVAGVLSGPTAVVVVAVVVVSCWVADDDGAASATSAAVGAAAEVEVPAASRDSDASDASDDDAALPSGPLPSFPSDTPSIEDSNDAILLSDGFLVLVSGFKKKAAMIKRWFFVGYPSLVFHDQAVVFSPFSPLRNYL